MSAFLGPIHYWLFKKIQFQDKLTGKIIDFYEKQYKQMLRENLNDKYGKLEQEPLENIIDETNIHGWLQSRVYIVEYRYADAVTSIIKNGDCPLKTLEKLCFDFGSENKPENFATAKNLFQYLNDILLDGMPCDRANDIISEDNDEVVWRRNICVHKKFWDESGGDIANYYLLRDSLIKGMFDGTEFVYEKLSGDRYAIRRL